MLQTFFGVLKSCCPPLPPPPLLLCVVDVKSTSILALRLFYHRHTRPTRPELTFSTHTGRFRAKHERERQSRHLRQKQAAMSIQSLYRMHKGMLTFQQRFVEDLAATTIQKLCRGVLGVSLSLSLSLCMPSPVPPSLPSCLAG